MPLSPSPCLCSSPPLHSPPSLAIPPTSFSSFPLFCSLSPSPSPLAPLVCVRACALRECVCLAQDFAAIRARIVSQAEEEIAKVRQRMCRELDEQDAAHAVRLRGAVIAALDVACMGVE